MSDLLKSEKHPDIPYVLFGCTCSLCQRFGGPDNQLKYDGKIVDADGDVEYAAIVRAPE